MRVLREGVARLDYDDPDHTYQVTVTTVPRRRLEVPNDTIAEVGGIGIRLTSVEISSDVTVVIDAQDGSRYQEVLEAFQATYRRWESTTDRPMPRPPAWPADEFFGCIRLRDDVGTDYALRAGRAGGSGTEFECTYNFDPVPPIDAHSLRVDVVDHHVVGTVILNL